MSRYAVNKVLWQVARSEAMTADFKADPESFLAGRPLTEEEYRQVLTRDLAGLYAAGAHPFLLYTFNIRVSEGWGMPMMKDYVQALGGIEPPLDIST